MQRNECTNHPLEQRLSVKGDLAPGDIWQLLDTFLILTTGVDGVITDA